MVQRIRSRYYLCRTSGTGACWYCDKRTNQIFEDNKDDSETFCCKLCFINIIKDFRGKRRIMRSIHIKNKQVGIVQ
ncbi:hypothetical protein LCGC14_1241450 [marine sediment metagenome]|uniref:Uncharacterized protein n=1 Tax=marine sediment metagenome TaxID=412755 RepID=A0A0F9P9V6_9ZZZZ